VNDVALSVKQEKFCLEYAKLGNARQAYINAGYDCKNENTIDASASRLLSNVKVKNRLAELAEETKSNAIADIQEMQEVLTEIIRQVREEEVIVNEMNMGVTTTKKMKKKASIKEVISAIEKLGKMQGAFSEKVELEIAVPVFSGEDALEE
jgi:phage terminase small subunit